MSGMRNPFPGLGSLYEVIAKAQKRKVYFAFHFADVMRVNNVRQAWKIDHPDAADNRSFYDSSLWESRQLEDAESLKNLIRDGEKYTSAVCVLVGSETWSRRWVRYEIARAVIDDRGLLAVHLNSIRHHARKQADAQGHNPLGFMGVGKVQERPANALWGQRNSLANLLAVPAPQYYLFELTTAGWVRYQDYMKPVTLPRYLADPDAGYVMPLSAGTAIYDFVSDQGHKNIGIWIDQAAQRVGR
jgi:Thoeris protein ThsB, TIR-like domain